MINEGRSHLVRRASLTMRFGLVLCVAAAACGSTVNGTAIPHDGGADGPSQSASSGAPADADAGGGAGAGDANVDATPTTPSGISCQTNAGGCSCTAPDGRPGGGGPTCSTGVIADAVCCADKDWPAATTTCACRSYVCTSTFKGGCSCRIAASDAATTSRSSCFPSSGEACCASASGCDCSASIACSGTEDPVAQCSADTQPCAPTQHHVSSCSP